MRRTGILVAGAMLAGCSYLQRGSTAGTAAKPSAEKAPAAKISTGKLTSAGSVLRAMHDRFGGKYIKTMSFLNNNTAYTTTGEERHSQWYEHIEFPGKLRIAFLPATQKSGLVQVGDKVASFDNGMRIDFRPNVNPTLLLTGDVYVSPLATIMRGLDSLGVDTDVLRTDEWEGRPVYVIGAKAADTTSSQMWVDSERLQLVRFIQREKQPSRTIISDIRVRNYKDVQGYEIPTEYLTLRNGRPVWREQYADIRVNETFPAGTFDQARWNDIPIPK
ncbi:MAG: hypothetical protein ABR585_03790 [Gemmatimonadaceae bacterium]